MLMSETGSLERCQTYIDCHSRIPRGAGARDRMIAPTVTISRQTGAGGTTVANLLADWLQRHGPSGSCPWTVFDKNLVHKALEDHNLPSRLAQFMPEDKVSGIADAVEELLGLHPASWKLVRQTTETILQLAELGHAVLLGRGANVITAHLENAIHVRLVGSTSCRVERVMARHKISRNAALAFLRKTDTGRRRYLQRYFSKDIDDPLLYHFTINTDELEERAVAEWIGNVVLTHPSWK